MLYAVLLEDDDAFAHVRAKFMQQHLAFLEANAANILSAGPLADSADGSAAGGLWLVRADDADAAWSLVRNDPFWPTGLRRSVRVLAWRQVFADGARL